MKEYVRVTRPANGLTTVTVTQVDEGLTAKWSTKTGLFPEGSLKRAVETARVGAESILAEIRGAL